MLKYFYQDSKKILCLAGPLLTSRITSTLIGFIAVMMLARFGHLAFAASAVGYSIYATFIMIVMGFTYASGIMIGHAFGAKEYWKIRQIVGRSAVLSLLLGGVVIVLMLHLTPILHLFHQSPKIIPIIQHFLDGMAAAILPIILYSIMSQYVSSVSKPQVATICSLLSAPISLLLCYGFIFGRLGLPQLGIAGIGTAYCITFTLSSCALFLYTHKHRYFKSFRLYTQQKGKKTPGIIRQLLQLGAPMSIQYGAEIAVFAVITMLIGLFGTVALAAQQIVFEIALITLMIAMGIAQATAILISQSRGRNEPHMIRRYGMHSTYLTLIILASIGLAMLLCPKFFIGFFINPQQSSMQPIVHLATLFFTVTAFSQCSDGLRNVLTGALRGLHDSKTPMWIAIFITWGIILPCGWLLSFYFKLGPVGFKLSTLFAVSLGAVILFYRFRKATTAFQ